MQKVRGPRRDARGRFVRAARVAIPPDCEIARDKGVAQIRKQRQGSWSNEKREIFLDTLAATANVLDRAARWA